MRISVYLDDGLGSARDFARCEAASLFVKTSLQLSGFLYVSLDILIMTIFIEDAYFTLKCFTEGSSS